MSTLCPSCGKEVERGFCVDCFLKLHPVKLKEFSLKICHCGRYLYHGKWKSNLKKSLPKLVKKNLIFPREITLRKVQILSKEIKKSVILVEIEVIGNYQNETLVQKINSRIKVKKDFCDRCKKRPEYYEAIIQFRSFKPKFKMNPKWIVNARKIHGGVDFYLTEKGYARKMAREFRKKGFQVKESEKLVGVRKNGKRKSRLSISIKPGEE